MEVPDPYTRHLADPELMETTGPHPFLLHAPLDVKWIKMVIVTGHCIPRNSLPAFRDSNATLIAQVNLEYAVKIGIRTKIYMSIIV